MSPTRERGTIEQAVAVLGISVRAVQSMAAAGQIPGAAKFGRRWTFDLGKLRRFVDEREFETWQLGNAKRHLDASGRVIPYSVVSVSRARRNNGPLKQTIQRLRASVTKLERKKS